MDLIMGPNMDCLGPCEIGFLWSPFPTGNDKFEHPSANDETCRGVTNRMDGWTDAINWVQASV